MGVVNSEQYVEMLNRAKAGGFAYPAIKVSSSQTLNAALAGLLAAGSDGILQVTTGGADYWSGPTVKNRVSGALGFAAFAREVAKNYGITIALHTDHCAKDQLDKLVRPLISISEDRVKRGEDPLFNSHMWDGSAVPMAENMAIAKEMLKLTNNIGAVLEIEVGVVGGEEDGVDNSDVDNAKLYTQPEEVSYAYENLNAISNQFTIAAAFGNVHGVYKPGNVQLEPKILLNSQQFIQNKFNTSANPVNFVFHGGSGSSREEIREAITYGAVKMNIDTDMQWAFWDGIRQFEAKNRPFLQGQIGNPDGAEKPNKKFYDPRVWLREGEKTFVARLKLAFEDLNCLNRNL
jgi:fructose-bisphosphate aldolase class II